MSDISFRECPHCREPEYACQCQAGDVPLVERVLGVLRGRKEPVSVRELEEAVREDTFAVRDAVWDLIDRRLADFTPARDVVAVPEESPEQAELRRLSALREEQASGNRLDDGLRVEPDTSVASTAEQMTSAFNAMASSAALRAVNGDLVRLLRSLLEWDHFDGAGDGPYWRKTINAAIAKATSEGIPSVVCHGDEYSVRCPHCGHAQHDHAWGVFWPPKGESRTWVRHCWRCKGPISYSGGLALRVTAERQV